MPIHLYKETSLLKMHPEAIFKNDLQIHFSFEFDRIERPPKHIDVFISKMNSPLKAILVSN
jgi:hypothetical protein